MFIDIKEKQCLVVGGGKVALRKVQVLLDFGASVTVAAPVISDEIKSLGQVQLLERKFQEPDLDGKLLVVAATDDISANREVAGFCKRRGIPVNAVDQQEDCTFIFPAYVKQGDAVAAFSSSGKSPVVTQYLKTKEKDILTEQVGALNDCLGYWRDTVKQLFATEEERKRVYQRILELGLRRQEVPADEEIWRLLENCQKTKR